ncbi:hypothetical protein C5O80_13555 [Burkholderia sp. SRS-46]|nr:hypothetical protein C5O80_13555 [Burkholderia sp. SRS-46]
MLRRLIRSAWRSPTQDDARASATDDAALSKRRRASAMRSGTEANDRNRPNTGCLFRAFR